MQIRYALHTPYSPHLCFSIAEASEADGDAAAQTLLSAMALTKLAPGLFVMALTKVAPGLFVITEDNAVETN